MSQRLIKPGLSRPRPVPGTIIGYGKRGPIFVQAGASPDDEGDGDAGGGDGTDEDSDDEDDSDDDGDEDDDKDKKSKSKKTGEDEDDAEYWRGRYEKTKERMKAADRHATSLQRQIDELKSSADVPAEVKRELEEMRPKIDAQQKTIDTLTEANKKLEVKLAATTMSLGFEWEDAETAFNLADLSDVEIDDKGRVDKRALKAALKQVAKEKPYLVKKKAKDDGDKNDVTNTGSTMNGGRKGGRNDDAARKEALKSRFPVLGSR